MPTSKLLRNATAASHKAAEVRLDATSILNGTLSASEFTEMIRIHFCVWSTVSHWWPVEIDAKPTAQEFLADMVEALHDDLLLSGLKPPLSQHLLLDENDLATRYGVLYVLRGSTLGGTMINRKLRSCALLAGLPAFHFHGACEALPGKEWPAFLREMDAAVLTEAEQLRAVAGAEAVFGLYLKG